MWNTMTAARVVKGPFAFCSGTVNDIGFYKANPGQSQTWNLLLRKESSLEVGKRQWEKEK